MEKKEFKEWLETVAEIKELKPVKDPNIRVNEDTEDLVRHGDEWVEVTAKENPTLGFKFIKVKDKNALCELGCGQIVTNQIVEKKMLTHPKKHWRTRCASCGDHVSPDGKGFITGGANIQNAYVKHFKKLDPNCMPYNAVDDDGREYTEIIRNDSVIKKYK